MAISQYVAEIVIKSGRDDLIRDLLNRELKRLRDQRRYYAKKEAQLPSDVDYDKLVRMKAKENLIQEQINELVSARKDLKNKHTKATSKMLDVAKQQKTFTKDSKAFEKYASQFDDNINETFYAMFHKGQFRLTDFEMEQFDKLFNKYGIGITDTIKRNIAKRYKHWSSDLAYQILTDWTVKAVSVMDKVEDSDKQLFKDYLLTVKGRL